MRTQAICLGLAIVLVCPFTSGQWVQTNVPDTVVVGCFAESGTHLFAGIRGWTALPVNPVFLFSSTNSGKSWAAVDSGLTNTRVLCLAASGTNLFAGTYAGHVFLSTNNGTNWAAADSGLCWSALAAHQIVFCLAVSGANLFAGTDDGVGVYLSTNSGKSWAGVDSGLTNTVVLCLAASGTNLFAGTNGTKGGVFVSTNNGTNWTEVDSGLTDRYISSLAVKGTRLFAGTPHGVYLTTNNGTNWTGVNIGLTNPYVWSLAVSGSNLFAGTNGGVFLSTNDGTSWTTVNEGLTDTNVIVLAVSGSNLFAGGLRGGVWRRPLSEMVTSISQGVTMLPHDFLLRQNYPNPFNPSTTIKYELPKSSMVRLSVYDMLGREVSVLVNERRDAGVHAVRFDAARLSSGVYLYRLKVGDFVQSKKLVILR